MKDKDYDEFMKKQLWPGFNSNIGNLLTLNVGLVNQQLLKENERYYQAYGSLDDIPERDFDTFSQVSLSRSDEQREMMRRERELYESQMTPYTSPQKQRDADIEKDLALMLSNDDINNNNPPKPLHPYDKFIEDLKQKYPEQITSDSEKVISIDTMLTMSRPKMMDHLYKNYRIGIPSKPYHSVSMLQDKILEVQQNFLSNK